MDKLKFHDDERRSLIEMKDGDFKTCKIAILKKRAVVGKHYHLHKDERFLLLKGHAYYIAVGNSVSTNLDAPVQWDVPRGEPHAFDLSEGSILIGLANGPYDEKDETRAAQPWLNFIGGLK